MLTPFMDSAKNLSEEKLENIQKAIENFKNNQ
jgi:hypothetical protein